MEHGIWRRISIPKLFLVVIVLKVGASVAGWLLGSPWLLGFALPLALMALYIVLGLQRSDASVSDEKFADSCYYLGFIFTISSILIALFDIPSIGSKIGEISVRFGAAMVSTVLGLTVRVYLVNFRPDFQDAVKTAEAGLLDSVRSFRGQLDMAVGQLREFQNLIEQASKTSVAQVDIAIGEAAAAHSQTFAGLFAEIAERQQQLADDNAAHLKATTQTLSAALQDYVQTLASGSDRFESSVATYSASLETRLRLTALPEDFFAKRLAPTVERLNQAVAASETAAAAMAEALEQQSQRIGAALAGMGGKVQATSSAMDHVCAAVLDRGEVLDQGRAQIEAFGQLVQAIAALEQNGQQSAAKLKAMEQTLARIVNDARQITESNQEIGRLAQRQTALSAEVERGVQNVLPRLQEADARVSGHLNEAIHAFDRSALKVSAALARQEAALTKVVQQLETLARRIGG